MSEWTTKQIAAELNIKTNQVRYAMSTLRIEPVEIRKLSTSKRGASWTGIYDDEAVEQIREWCQARARRRTSRDYTKQFSVDEAVGRYWQKRGYRPYVSGSQT